MMLNSSIPKSFLDKVGMTTFYLINLIPYDALNGDTLHEKWFSKLSDYSMFKIFGSHQNKGKFELEAKKMCFSRLF